MEQVTQTVTETAGAVEKKKTTRARPTAFGYQRDFLNNHFVYTVVSARAGGLSVGVNMNPDKLCNFDCRYCEVDRSTRSTELKLDVEVMAGELRRTLAHVIHGKLRQRPAYQSLPEELLELRHVALSGDGEPTLSPKFAEAVKAVTHVRARGEFPFFKIVLITNSTGLDRPQVQEGLSHFTQSDEIWAKLDGGTEQYFHHLTRPRDITLDKVLSNIMLVARQRPVVIQSLFPAINNQEPPAIEIEMFAYRLRDLKAAGAQISLVQIYSATRPTARPECGHLPLKTLSHIAQVVRQITGLKAEVF